MKTLKYKDREFLYKLTEMDCGEYGAFTCYETIFYDKSPITKTRKKWLLFGPLIEYTEYRELFKVWHETLSNDGEKQDKFKKVLSKYVAVLRQDPGLPIELVGEKWIGLEAFTIFKEIKGILLS